MTPPLHPRSPLSSISTNSSPSNRSKIGTVKEQRRYTHQERRNAILDHFDKGRSLNAIHAHLHIPKATLHTWFKAFETRGDEAPRPRGGRQRPPAISDAMKEVMLNKVKEVPAAPFRMLQAHLKEVFELQQPPSLSSISTALGNAHWTLKRLETEVEKRNSKETKAKRKRWCEEHMTHLDLHRVIFIDEAGFNVHLARRQGRAPEGQRAIQHVPNTKGKNMTLIAACSVQEGVLATSCHIGGTDRHRFASYLEEELLPQIEGQQRTLIMDNARFHHSFEPVTAVEQAGHRILFLPAYTPNFNAAEWLFGHVKPRVAMLDLQSRKEMSLSDHIQAKLREVTPDHIKGYTSNVQRWLNHGIQGRPMGPTFDAVQDEDATMPVTELPDSQSSLSSLPSQLEASHLVSQQSSVTQSESSLAFEDDPRDQSFAALGKRKLQEHTRQPSQRHSQKPRRYRQSSTPSSSLASPLYDLPDLEQDEEGLGERQSSLSDVPDL